MRLSLKDLSSLGRPLVVLGAAVALGSWGVVHTGKLVKRCAVELAAAQTKLKEARERVFRSGEEVQTIHTYVGPYRQLQRSGVVGDEQRLNWVDALRVANLEAQLYGVDYEVGSQTAFALAQEVNAGGLPVLQSVMKLKLGLLYETDLINFFRMLAGQNVGTFTVNQCSVQRMLSDVSNPTNQPTLRAECDLAWITIQPPEGGS